MNLTAPCASRATLTTTAPLVHRCPFRPEVDEGTIDITWTTAGATLELHALRAWLAGFAGDVISHEDITADIFDHLTDLPHIADVHVVTRWDTAGMRVVVTGAVPREPQLVAGA